MMYNIQAFEFPGVAQLVGRHIWDVEAARSSRATRTKTLWNRLISEGFSLFIAVQNLREIPAVNSSAFFSDT